MLDLINKPVIMMSVDREDRAMLRSNLSARSMPGDRQGHVYFHVPLSSPLSLGPKAINLLAWGEATSKAKTTEYGRPVGHMSISLYRHFPDESSRTMCPSHCRLIVPDRPG